MMTVIKMLKTYKTEFPVFAIHPDLTYLDSAATTLRPEAVSKIIYEYGTQNHANIHRGAYRLSYEATEAYNRSRDNIASFVGASADEIIFTYGTTDSLNFISRSLVSSGILEKGDEVVLSIFEHHSNIVPWQQVCKETGATLKYLYKFDNEIEEKITVETKVVSLTMMSNATGLILPIDRIINRAKEVGAIVILDAAQYVGHEPLNVHQLDVDFVAFSGHKMFGPTGIGILFAKEKWLNRLMPYRFGGDMIDYVTEQESVFAPTEEKFEAGTPNMDGVIGLSAAVDYIEKVGINNISHYLNDLRGYAVKRLRETEHVLLVDDRVLERLGETLPFGPVVAFEMEGVHPHDIASILDESQIAVRAGHHCAQPLMKYLSQPATCRVSLQIYNDRQDIDRLVEALKGVRRWLGYEA